MYKQLHALHVQYGPIISLKIGSGTLISVAGDGTHIKELLEKRGSRYSGRPVQMVTETAGGGDHFLHDMAKWRAARKQIVQHFASSVAKNDYHSVQEAESVQLLHEFLYQPDKFMLHSTRYTTSIMTCLVYGIRCEKYENVVVNRMQAIMTRTSEMLMPGGKPPVEDFPWLNYLPDFVSPWRARSKELGNWMDELYTGLAEAGYQRGLAGLNINNLAYKLRMNENQNRLTRHEQAFTCSIILEGGPDIVTAALLTCIMTLVQHPESQRRAQTEIDRISDEATLPRWQDQQSYPFVRAVIKEVLRWRPTSPIGIPHRLEQDDHYNGFFLPKDSVVICNAWAIHHNPERFDEPEKFKPERYLNDNMSMAESAIQTDPLKRDHFAFGAGRRVCPGIQTAEQSIHIALVRLLWAFDFSAPPGIEISTDHEKAFFGEVQRRPFDFPLNITPRSKQRAHTIDREMNVAREFYARYGLYK
ncbi:cytochrome P450 [Ceratobasidium sp. AG-I]|nr:cytochrome P450 [Ceratobasidium sp. AG-I]